MCNAIASSCTSLFWTIFLFVLLLYVMAVYVTALVAHHAHDRPEILEGNVGLYYNSVTLSCLTLFQAVTGGLDWREVLKPLVDDVSPYIALPFCFYIAFTVLAMLNVITGIFVESALTAARSSKDAEVQFQMRRLFLRIDADSSGFVSWEEFNDMLVEPSMLRCFKLLGVDPSEASGLFRLLDTDCSGEIDAEEFVMGCLRLQGSAKAIDLATLTYFNKRMATWWGAQMDILKETLARILERQTHAPAGSTASSPQLENGPAKTGRRSSTQSENICANAGRNSRRVSRVSASSYTLEAADPPDKPDIPGSLADFATWSGLKTDQKTLDMRKMRRSTTVPDGNSTVNIRAQVQLLQMQMGKTSSMPKEHKIQEAQVSEGSVEAESESSNGDSE
jgi:hypothetical protein